MAAIVPQDRVLVDLVDQFEPARQFAVSEIHQGRFLLWVPYHFGGFLLYGRNIRCFCSWNAAPGRP